MRGKHAWPRVETHYLWDERMNEMLVGMAVGSELRAYPGTVRWEERCDRPR